MYTDDCAALWALVSLLLLPEEHIHSLILDGLQILDHTHVETLPVVLVKMLEVLTGKIIALKAKLNLSLAQACAVSHYEGAGRPSRPTTNTRFDPLLAVHPVSEVRYAYRTVCATVSHQL